MIPGRQGSDMLISGANAFAQKYNGKGIKVDVSVNQLIPGTKYFSDICIEVSKTSTGPLLIPEGKFYFDYTDLDFVYRSPEFINVVSNKCFDMIGNAVVLSDKYQTNRFLTSKKNKFISEGMRVPLTDALINACNKIISLKLAGFNLRLISDDECESVEQRFENALLSGRCDVVVSDIVGVGPTGPGPIATAHEILEENDAQIKVTKIYVPGEFVSQSNVNARSIPIKMKRWIHIVG